MSNPNIDRSKLGVFRKKHLVAAGVFLLVMLLLTLVAQNIYYYVTPKVVVSKTRGGVIEKSLNLRLTRSEADSEEAFFPLKLPGGLPLYISELLKMPGDQVVVGAKLLRFNEKSVQDVRDAYAAALANAQKQLAFLDADEEQQAFTHKNQLDAVNRDINTLAGKSYASVSDEQAVKSAEASIKSMESALAKAREERDSLAILVAAHIETPNKLKQADQSLLDQEAALEAKRLELTEAEARAAANYTTAMADLTRRRTELVRDYEFAAARQLYGGKTRAELEADVAAAEADIAAFNELVTEDDCYRSPVEGTLERYYVARASSFNGMERVAAMTKASRTVIYEASVAKDDDLLAAGAKLTVTIHGKRIPFTIESKEKVGEGAKLVLRADTKALEDAEISPEAAYLDAVLLITSERYEVIVPSGAVARSGDGDCVYILSEQEGYFGTQNYIVAVNVEVLETGGGYVAVRLSAYGNIRIVTSWDRALQNLGKVIVVAEQ